jgi:hypothetical protein
MNQYLNWIDNFLEESDEESNDDFMEGASVDLAMSRVTFSHDYHKSMSAAKKLYTQGDYSGAKRELENTKKILNRFEGEIKGINKSASATFCGYVTGWLVSMIEATLAAIATFALGGIGGVIYELNDIREYITVARNEGFKLEQLNWIATKSKAALINMRKAVDKMEEKCNAASKLDAMNESVDEHDSYSDDFLEESDNDLDYYYEASEKNKSKFAAAKLKASNAVSVVAEKIKDLIDNIIQKIRELSLQLQVKFTQLKFKQALKKVGRDAIKEVKANPNLSKQGKALVAESIKLLIAFEEKSQKIATPYYTGKKDIAEFNNEMQSAVDKFNAQLKILDAKISVMDNSVLQSQSCMTVINSIDASIRDIVGAYNRTIVTTNKKLEDLKKKGVYAAKVYEAEVYKAEEYHAEVYEDGESPKSPSKILTITSKVASVISSAVGAVTSFIHKILSKIASAGDKVIRSVANATATKKPKKVIGESVEDELDDNTSLDEEYDESWEDEIDAIIASL